MVIVQFVVDKQGNVTNAQVLQGIGSGLDQAALEAVKQAEFEPGRQQGEPVPVKMSLPVRFTLGNSSTAQEETTGQSILGRLKDFHKENGKISGKLVDKNGLPISGANLWVEGLDRKIGAATGSDGRFTIVLPEANQNTPQKLFLHISHPSFDSQTLVFFR